MIVFHFFTRGGQLIAHQYRMLKQICLLTFFVSFLIGVSVTGFLIWHKTTAFQRRLYGELLYAEWKLNMSAYHQEQVTQNIRNGKRQQRVSALTFLRHPLVLKQKAYVENVANEAARAGVWSAILTALGMIVFFVIRGLQTNSHKLERGGQLVSPQTLKRLLKRKRQAGDLHLDDLPLLKGRETSHILITGTTGSGKTNCFHTLLPQIRKRGNRAIVVDLTGDFVSRYYQQKTDILLNPLDARTERWSPWLECLETSHYDGLASSLISTSTSLDDFWSKASRALLVASLKKLRHEKDIERLYHILVQADLATFQDFFHETEAGAYTHNEGEKMTLSIRATLANHVRVFQLLKNTEHFFSFRKWVVDEKTPHNWLFLTARPDQRESLKPLLSCWLDTALNALMSLPPNQNRRLWFVMDELPALQKLPSLEVGLAEGRKYGGCILAGVQSLSQIASTYGTLQAQAILDLFNTKIFFRNTDPQTTTWISKVLGEAETTQHIESLSYGANTIRDGVNLSQQTRTKPLVLPAEIANLQDCEAYVRLPGDLPITKIKMRYTKYSQIASAFKLLLTQVS